MKAPERVSSRVLAKDAIQRPVSSLTAMTTRITSRAKLPNPRKSQTKNLPVL